MKTTKEMPRQGQFVAVWEVDRELKAFSYRYNEDTIKKLFIYVSEEQSWELCISAKNVEEFLLSQKNITFITSLTEDDPQDGIRLELDDKLRWLAKDMNGRWWLYTNKPIYRGDDGKWFTNGGGATQCTKVFKNLPDCKPENSLHEILKYGVIRPWREPFTPVVGEFYEFCDDPEFPKEKCRWAFLKSVDNNYLWAFVDFRDTPFKHCRKPQHIKLKED